MVESDGSLLRLSERKREAIVQAAIHAFTEEGFDHASMDGIAAIAGVSKRTVYNHFASKDGLFKSILAMLHAAAASVPPFVYADDESLAQQLERYASQLMRFYMCPQARRLARVILPRLVQHPELGSELAGEGRLFEHELTGWIKQAARAKQLKKCDASIAARQFIGLLEAFTVWPQILKNAPDPSAARCRKLARENTALFLSYYAREQAS